MEGLTATDNGVDLTLARLSPVVSPQKVAVMISDFQGSGERRTTQKAGGMLRNVLEEGWSPGVAL